MESEICLANPKGLQNNIINKHFLWCLTIFRSPLSA